MTWPAGVGRLRAGEDQVGLERLHGGREHLRRGERARAVQGVVDDVHRLVRTHRQGLADRFGRAVGAHGEDRHLTAVRLLELQRLLDGVFVHLIDDVARRRPVDGVVVTAQGALGPESGTCLTSTTIFIALQRGCL
jgi:hypothetical protein